MFRIPGLTEEEFQALMGLLDAGCRASGLRALEAPQSLAEKLKNAEQVDSDTPSDDTGDSYSHGKTP